MNCRLALLLAALLAFLPLRAARADEFQDLRESALLACRTHGVGEERGAKVAKLAALDSAEASNALVECLTALAEKNDLLVKTHENTVKQYGPFKGYSFTEQKDWDLKARLQRMLADEEEKLASDTLVRDAVAAAITKLERGGAVSVLEKAATTSPSSLVRAALFAGLIRNEWMKPSDTAKKAIKDEDPRVRLAALEALSDRKDPLVVELLVKSLNEADWPLRQAAVRALGAQGEPRAIPALITAMQLEDGLILEDYAAALSGLTGQRLGIYPETWRKWWEDNRAALEKQGAKGAPPKPAAAPPPKPDEFEYYGVVTASKKVLFIMDCSGSMNEPLNAKGPTTGKKEVYSGLKIDVARQVLLKAIRNLSDKSRFGVLLFNHRFTDVLGDMKPADRDNKAKAELAVEDAKPVGATWTYGVLREAFEIAKRTGNGYSPGIDTIFLLSDGAPTDDKPDKADPMEPGVILNAVRDWNRDMKIKIHTIAIDPRLNGGNFVRLMRGLASMNNGTYTPIGAQE